MKQIPKLQLLSLSFWAAIVFWIYSVVKNNIKANQLFLDFQAYPFVFLLTLLFLIVWITFFNFLYRFANLKIWIGKIFIFIASVFLSLFVADLLLTPSFYYFESINLLKNTKLLGAMHLTIHHELFLLLALVFVAHDLMLIRINKNMKLNFLKVWVVFMIVFVIYFNFG